MNKIISLSRIIKILFISILLAINFSITHSQNSWSTLIDSVSTLSSPRAVYLNLDGTKDIILVAGTDSIFINDRFVALDGVSGQLFWNLSTTDEIFTSAILKDINNDTIPDVFIGEKNTQLFAIDGSNCIINWKFSPQNTGLNLADSGSYKFYFFQICNDFDVDNVNYILAFNREEQKDALFNKYSISPKKGHFVTEIKTRNSLGFQKIIILG